MGIFFRYVKPYNCPLQFLEVHILHAISTLQVLKEMVVGDVKVADLLQSTQEVLPDSRLREAKLSIMFSASLQI